MLRRWLICCACLLLAALPARAVVVLKPEEEDDWAARLAAARRDIEEAGVGRYGMTPIPASCVADGRYSVTVASNSKYFRATEAELTVSGGAMTLRFVIGSSSYDYVYPGAAREAEADPEGRIVGERAEGGTAFTLALPALNAPFECAAHSAGRDRWYDRRLLVDAAALPEDALDFSLPDYALIERALAAYAPEGDAGTEESAPEPAAESVEPLAIDLPDGEYAIEVSLSGGSGRASVSSPTVLRVRDGRAWARLLWSSTYYDYMLVGGMRYENLSESGGNSSFEIPIPAMDAPVDVIADTTAMGEPVEIAYQLTFYRDTVGDVSQVPQEAAKRVLMISLAIIVGGGVLNHIVKKRRR